MATHRCKTECFHDGNLYQVGQEATFLPDAKVPEHFEKIGPDSKDDGEESPRTRRSAAGRTE